MASSSVHIITHRLGTDGSYTYICRDADGAIVDISADIGTLALGLRAYPGGSGVADEADLAVAGATTGVATITIEDTDLEDTVPGDYYLTIHFTLTVGATEQTYPLEGNLILRLLPDAT